MDIIKKFIIEIILVGLFVALCYFGYKYKKQPHISTQEINTTESEIDTLMRQNRRIDTLIIRQETSLQTIENNHYHEKINIILLSNDSQFNLLRSNIARYSYLLDTTRR